MAVELRCPECQAKLRLPVPPEPDSEIECPKCAHVFPCDDNLVHAGGRRGRTAAKEAAGRAGRQTTGKSPRRTRKRPGRDRGPGQALQTKKRKAKKRKTKPVVIAAIIVGAVMVIGSVVGRLIWFFMRQSASEEMITYLPDECDEVSGINIGHLQKYPEFYKTCEQTFGNSGFKAAADVFADALGEQTSDILDYVVQGKGTSNGVPVEATVLRTKAEYDTSLLSNIPGATEYSQDGVTYYTINDIPALGYAGLRVFAPTNRLVVFCPGTLPEATFKAMLNGNKDNRDATVLKRAAPLVKHVIRGTAWKFMLYPPGGKSRS